MNNNNPHAPTERKDDREVDHVTLPPSDSLSDSTSQALEWLRENGGIPPKTPKLDMP